MNMIEQIGLTNWNIALNYRRLYEFWMKFLEVTEVTSKAFMEIYQRALNYLKAYKEYGRAANV